MIGPQHIILHYFEPIGFSDALCARATMATKQNRVSTYKLNLGPIGPKMRPESCETQSVDGPTDETERHSLTSVGLIKPSIKYEPIIKPEIASIH